MRLKKTKLQRFRYNLYCECGGEMVFDKQERMYGIYRHVCTDCRQREDLTEAYPYQDFEEVTP